MISLGDKSFVNCVLTIFIYCSNSGYNLKFYNEKQEKGKTYHKQRSLALHVAIHVMLGEVADTWLLRIMI